MRKVRIFPYCHFNSQVHIHGNTIYTNKSYTTLCEMKVALPLASIMFLIHTDHFLEGVNLTGGIPLFGHLDLLRVDGISTGSLLMMEG